MTRANTGNLPDPVDPAMPELIILGRHGQSEGQVVQQQGPAAFTPEFRRRSTNQWSVTRNGFGQSKAVADYLLAHVLDGPLVMDGVIDLGVCAATVRAEQSLGAILLRGLQLGRDIVRRVTGGVERIGTEGTDGVPEDFWVAGVTDSRINEIEFGWLSSSPTAERDERYQDAVQAREVDHFTARPPGGESPRDVLMRARDWLGSQARMHTRRGVQSTYASTHGRFGTMVDFALRGINPLQWDKFNANNKIGNADLLFFARRNPFDPTDLRVTAHWRGIARPWQNPDKPPVWTYFEAPKALSLSYLLRDIPTEWLTDPPADRTGQVPGVDPV